MSRTAESASIESLCLRVTSGGTPSRKREDYWAQGTIPWVKTGELKDCNIYGADEKITETGLRSSSAKVFPENTVLMAMYGDGKTITSLGIVKNEVATNQACCALIADPEKCDYRYLYYALMHHRRKLIGLVVAGAQRNLSLGIIKRFNIGIYPLKKQRKIASILSAYDDLIENNRRRIQLLEQAARLLYREWFIYLRFPGHEHATITDGVPEGWEMRSLEDCVSVLETGSRPKGGVAGIDEGVPSIGAESIVGAGQFDYSKTKYIPEAFFSSLKKGIVQDRDVLVYKDGGRPGHFTPHVSIFGDDFPFEEMALNSHVYRVRGTSDVTQEFLYYHLSSEPMLKWMNKAGSGAAIPGIARKNLLRLPLMVPSPRLLEMFSEVASDALTQILCLALTVKKLSDARDLLLPRLMNGEIAV